MLKPLSDGFIKLRAPAATHVDLVGEVLQGRTPQAMARDPDGVWSVWSITVGPLPPEIWIYNFRIEGVDLPDPANPSQMPRAARTANSTMIGTVKAEVFSPIAQRRSRCYRHGYGPAARSRPS